MLYLDWYSVGIGFAIHICASWVAYAWLGGMEVLWRSESVSCCLSYCHAFMYVVVLGGVSKLYMIGIQDAII